MTTYAENPKSTTKNARDIEAKLQRAGTKLHKAMKDLEAVRTLLENEGYEDLVKDTDRMITEHHGAISILRRSLLTEEYAWMSYADARSRKD